MVLINSCPDRLDPTTAASRALSRSPTPRAFMVYRDQIQFVGGSSGLVFTSKSSRPDFWRIRFRTSPDGLGATISSSMPSSIELPLMDVPPALTAEPSEGRTHVPPGSLP